MSNNKQDNNEIAQLKRKNKKLKQKVKNYSALLHEGNNAIIIFDLDGNIIAWDKGAEALYGWKEDEILHSSIFDIIPESKKSDFEEFITEVHNNEADDIYESQRLTKSGQRRDIWFTYNLLEDSNNQHYAIATTERDITKRKKTTRKLKQREKKYKSLVESLGVGLIEFNLNNVITFVNPAAKEIFSYKTSTLIDKNINELFQHKNQKIFNDHIKELQNKEKVNFEIEINIANKKNSIIAISLTKNYSIDGDILSYIGIFRDVTEVRRMEEEMIKADKLESLGLLAGGLAHDFRNILSIFMGNLTLLKMKVGDDDKIKNRLEKTEQAVERAKDLTKQLRSLSTGGQIELEETEITSFIKQSVQLSLTGQNNINLKFNAEENLPNIKIDKGQINQVVSNLVINAYQAMDEEGEIKIGIKQVGQRSEKGLTFDKDYIEITIRDNGPGIPSEQLQNIFEPYFTTKSKGTGLGLSTARSIIRKHGGKIEVSSSLGKGTKFFIYLPVNSDYSEQQKDEQASQGSQDGKILFLEGDSGIRSIAKVMIERIGFKTDFVANKEESFQYIKEASQNEKEYKAVFLDPQVTREENGRKIAKSIRALDPDMKIIGILSDIQSSESPPPEFDTVLGKPLKFNKLKAALSGL